ncbi:MAG: hypothetical protein WAW07_06110 [Bacteroidales bacterium]
MSLAILTLQVLMLAFSGNEALSTEMFSAAGDTAKIIGQASAWINGNQNNDFSFASGIRYIPSAYYGVKTGGNKLIDFEASANLFGSIITGSSRGTSAEARIKPYRLWARYSSDQFELRLGLQKINFGSASMLRPLMWFDQMDPRDPLRLTDGVWGLLGRYYFLNNANIWLWGLYGNHDPRAWETDCTLPMSILQFHTIRNRSDLPTSQHSRFQLSAIRSACSTR